MTTDRDSRTRIVLSWLREDGHENAERMLLRALDEVDATPQRRSWWPAWRFDRMNTYAKLIAAAATVLLVGVVAYQFLPGNGGVGGQPTIAPSQSPAPLAVGTFTSHGVTTELDARDAGPNVTGTMTVSDTGMRASVALECTGTIGEGLIAIGGLVTDSTFDDNFPEGRRVAIIFQRGSPVKAVWYIAHVAEAPVDSCQALVEDVIDPEEAAPGLEPIEGTVELRP